MRIGSQIRDFMNRYLNDRIELIKSVSHKRDSENVQMPAENIEKLHEHLVRRYIELKGKSQTDVVVREISKVLGKYHFKMLLMHHTSCALQLYSSCCGRDADLARLLTLFRKRPLSKITSM